MDAIIKLLPSPLNTGKEIKGINIKTGNIQIVDNIENENETLIASAFKVQHDFQRGSLVFFRVYRGKLKVKDVLLNTTLNEKERVNKLLLVEADSHEEVNEVNAGQIAAAVGLKLTRTGDTLLDSKKTKKNQQIILDGIDVPPPVFTSSVKVPSSSDKPNLWDALKIMEREDPSIRVVLEDPQTEETLVSGMGELHMEVVEDKLKRQFKLPQVEFSPPGIAFRESLSVPLNATYESDTVIGDNRQYAKISLELIPIDHLNNSNNHHMDDNDDDGNNDTQQHNYVMINNGNDFDKIKNVKDKNVKQISTMSNISFHAIAKDGVFPKITPDDNTRMKHMVEPIAIGVERALAKGPLSGFPISGVCVKLYENECEFTDESTHGAIIKATERCIKRALETDLDSINLMEPIMNVEINADSNSAGAILSDLNSSRRASVREVGGGSGSDDDDDGANVAIFANVPLREMVGYSTSLRSLTSGEGSFSMQFIQYDLILSQKIKDEIIQHNLENPISMTALDLHVY